MFYAVVGSVAVVLLVVVGVVCACCCVCCRRKKQNLSDIMETEVTVPPTTNRVYNNGSSPSSSDNSLPEIVKDEKGHCMTPPPTVSGIDEIDLDAPPCYDEIEQRSLPRRLYYTNAAPPVASYPCNENDVEKGEELELQCDYNEDL